jgi:hypothetical protein
MKPGRVDQRTRVATMNEIPASQYSAFVAMRKRATYLQRGRYLAGVGTPELKSQWLAKVRQWLRDGIKAPQDHRSREDLEAELDMRGEDLPPDAFYEFDAALKRAMAEPPTLAEQQRGEAEFAEYLQSLENPN